MTEPEGSGRGAPAPTRRHPVEVGGVERRPSDVALLVVAALGVVLAGMWAQASSSIDTSLAAVVNGLPDALEGLADVLVWLGSLWVVAILALALLVVGRRAASRDVAIAGTVAWAVTWGLHELLGTRDVAGLTVRAGDGPAFPVSAVAVATALAVVLGPYLARPLRILLLAVVVAVSLASLYLGLGLSADVWGGLFLGLAVGAAVQVAFGAPGGRPSATEVREALEQLGIDVADVRPAAVEIPRATVMDVRLASGSDARAVAYGRDQRDGQIVARLWHTVMYKSPGQARFASRLHQVEHTAYALLLADRAGVRVPHLVATGVAGPNAALLVTDVVAGRSFAELSEPESTDAVLGAAWSALVDLHAAGVAHGALTPDGMVLLADGRVGFADLGDACVGDEPYWRHRDVATLLVLTAGTVGSDRAIAAALAALGADELAAAIPLVQPAALPAGTGAGVKHFGKVLKELRDGVAKAAGVDAPAPLKVKRLSLVNIGMLAGVMLALALAIPGLEGVDWQTVQQEFSHAVWGWAVLALVLWPLIPIAWATALMGCVTIDLPFVPTVLVQVACSFLNLITPNGIGGTALQLDYLHHQDVPVASGASAMVLSTGVGGAIQMLLFLGAAAITATTVDTSSSGGSVTLGMIAVVAALIGVILWIPKVRSKVVPAVKRAANDIWTVLRNPRKGMQLFGGDTAGNLIYPALLGLCLLAFGESLSFAQLVVVQVGAGMLGNVAPVPGGIGVQEAALTAGLTSFGIPAAPALATVIVFRTITFAIPPVFGFFTLRWLRRTGYA